MNVAERRHWEEFVVRQGYPLPPPHPYARYKGDRRDEAVACCATYWCYLTRDEHPSGLNVPRGDGSTGDPEVAPRSRPADAGADAERWPK